MSRKLSTKEIDNAVVKALRNNPDAGRYRLAATLGLAEHVVRDSLARVRRAGGAENQTDPTPDRLAMVERALLKGPLTLATIEHTLGVPCVVALDLVDKLESAGKAHWQGLLLVGGKPGRIDRIPTEFLFDGTVQFGLVADTHLCCAEAREDVLQAAYDDFARLGIRDVLHAGNMVDGYVARINGGSVFCTTMQDQAAYVIERYPCRPGITTHFITGDDHEGWWQKEGFSFGEYLQFLAAREGRADLQYRGHVEADFALRSPGAPKDCPPAMLKLQHPGGGSAYARSYTAQKQVEAFQPGEKPAILVQGHYHVSNYMVERGVHVIGMPGMQDQTIFARKKRLRMEVGYAVLTVELSQKNTVSAATVRFAGFYDREFYRPFLKSDRLVRGEFTATKHGKKEA